jgi:alpha-N-arabinofuranosidase
MIVDEWGTWHDVEPGTNPGFLYQQNTMRDALVAAITLDIFNRHCDRVVMANLAQTVNVLQAVILTDGDQMVLTPTYHVFDLYKAHHDAKEIGCRVETDETGDGKWNLPQITASASEKDGVITVTMANLAADKPAAVVLEGANASCVCGRILKGEMHQYNDFGDSPLAVEALEGCRLEDGKIVIELPACCVAEITIK